MYTFPAGTTISPGSYLVVSIAQNNYVDDASTIGIYLYDSSLSLVDSTSMSYPGSHTDQSWARAFNTSANAPEDSWVWDSSPTPNAQNDVCELNSLVLVCVYVLSGVVNTFNIIKLSLVMA